MDNLYFIYNINILLLGFRKLYSRINIFMHHGFYLFPLSLYNNGTSIAAKLPGVADSTREADCVRSMRLVASRTRTNGAAARWSWPSNLLLAVLMLGPCVLAAPRRGFGSASCSFCCSFFTAAPMSRKAGRTDGFWSQHIRISATYPAGDSKSADTSGLWLVVLFTVWREKRQRGRKKADIEKQIEKHRQNNGGGAAHNPAQPGYTTKPTSVHNEIYTMRGHNQVQPGAADLSPARTASWIL